MALRTMTPLDVGDFDSAPLRVVQAATLPATPDQVFAEFADPARWIGWFPLMREARWTSALTAAAGAEREVALRVFGRFAERILVWQPGERFTFTMTASNSPLAARMAEDWRLSRDGGGTLLTWIVAAHPTALGNVMRPMLRLTMRRMFRQASANLRRLLSARASSAN